MSHETVVKVGLDLNVFGGNMLDMYAKNGGLEEAMKAFSCISKPTVAVFNACLAQFS